MTLLIHSSGRSRVKKWPGTTKFEYLPELLINICSPASGSTVKVRKFGLINLAKVWGMEMGATLSESPHISWTGNSSLDKLSNHRCSNLHINSNQLIAKKKMRWRKRLFVTYNIDFKLPCSVAEIWNSFVEDTFSILVLVQRVNVALVQLSLCNISILGTPHWAQLRSSKPLSQTSVTNPAAQFTEYLSEVGIQNFLKWNH